MNTTAPATMTEKLADLTPVTAWSRRVRRIGGFIQAAFAALWLVRASLAIGGRVGDALIAVSAAAVIAVYAYAIRVTAGVAPRPSGPEARRIERSVTIATIAELVAAFVLPVVVTAAGHPSCVLPSIVITIGPLLLWLDHEVVIPRLRLVGWVLTAGPVVLVATLSGPALAITTGIAAGVLLLGTALAGFRDLAVSGPRARRRDRRVSRRRSPRRSGRGGLICDNSNRRYDGPGRVRFGCRPASAGKARERVGSAALNPAVAAVRPIEPRSVVEQVMTELRRSILSGALAPGRELSLRELAEMLQVSIIPVREALRSLESEGLVVTRPGRSARVAPLDLDELRGLYRLRRRLEPEIAQRSCRLLSEADLDRLEQEAVGFGAEERTMNDIYDAHHEFHLALLAPAATSWDIRILSTLWRASERYIRIGWGRLDPDPQEHARREQYHVELVGAFRQRDPEVAAAAVLQHLSRNEQTALLALDPGPSPVTPVS